ncbi:HipA domain-containing protein [Vibrio tubiashii]|uniref:HipA domain-containing protein n=1 Tax=Vibrio tubiashii TaxID=29498 RepID=UPI003CE497F7
MGTKSKFWYTDQSNGREYLFKSIHTEDKQQNPIVRHGEDWAEKVACELADLLGMPHANYDLAVNGEERGIRSENFILEGDSMIFGNQLIEHVVISVLEQQLEKGQRSQTIDRVFAIMEQLIFNPPVGWEETRSIKTAGDIFVGYLMFDAWISNQDRHNENWAMIIDKQGKMALAPSFDHAASLGRNESDEKREARLYTKDRGQSVASYVLKCKSYFYNEGKQLKALEAFRLFAALKREAALEWLDRLENITEKQILDILHAVPIGTMSEVSKQFCFEILKENRNNLLGTREFILRTIEIAKEHNKK